MPVAQLDRALDSDSKGRWFESSRAYHTVPHRMVRRHSHQVHEPPYKRSIPPSCVPSLPPYHSSLSRNSFPCHISYAASGRFKHSFALRPAASPAASPKPSASRSVLRISSRTSAIAASRSCTVGFAHGTSKYRYRRVGREELSYSEGNGS